MTQIYTSVEPIYSLFDLKVELPDYLLNEYSFLINEDEIDTNLESDLESKLESDLECECASNPDVQIDTWENTLNEALIRLGNYIATNNVKM